jgi:hypothetical protein
MDYIKSFLVGAGVLAGVVALIGLIVWLASWRATLLPGWILSSLFPTTAFIYFSYQLGKEIRNFRD